MRRLITVIVAALLAANSTLAEAAGVSPTPALEKIIDAAKKEGALTLSYGANILGGAEGSVVAHDGIKGMFGVDLDVTYYPGASFAPMASRLYTELQANQVASTDVFNATAVEITPYLDRGMFRPIPWLELYPSRIMPDIVEADGRALRIVTKLPGVVYNKRLAPQFGALTTMHDLLKPEYKGKVYTEPYLAGFDVLVAKDAWGYEKTADFVRQFSQNVGGLVDCGATGRIASGEFPALALSCSGSVTHLDTYRDILSEVVLRDAAMRRFDYLCIPTHAAHPNAGILFALYVSSPEGQKRILQNLFGESLDSYPDSRTRADIEALETDGFKFIDVTIDWWGSHQGISADLGKLVKIVTQR